MRRLVSLALLFSCSPVPRLLLPRSLVAAAAPQKLVKIRVLGSKRFSEALIIRASRLKLGARVGPKTFKEAAGRLAATGAFSDVTYRYQSTAAGLTVVFRVSDGPKFYPCRFSNFVWFSEKELQDELRSRVPLFTGEVPLTGNLPEQVDSALESLLKSRGIQGTVHHALFGHEGGAMEAIRFRVRGATILTRQIEFEGAIEVDSKALQAAVRPLLGTDYDQSFVREFAVNNVSPLYWERGYLRVAFDDPTAALIKTDGPETAVAVTVPVREGVQYRLAEIHWLGNTILSTNDLEKQVHLRRGEPANAVQLQRDLESIQGPYRARGYLHAEVESKPVIEDATRTVSYELRVREGDLYRMGDLAIVGLDSSHARALKKRCQLRAGEPFDKSYWGKFISESGRHLPQNSQGWKISFQQSIDEASKTVNVTISFSPK